MPLIKHIHVNDLELIVWKIEESKAFFSQNLILNKEESEEYLLIQTENRKLEWLAARYVQRCLVNDSLLKDDCGKPKLESLRGFVSLSHCAHYAAASYSKSQQTGIDVELVHPRILRIADKFSSAEERSFVVKENEVTQLIALWCIKESVYKWYGKKNLNFINNIQVQGFSMNDKEAQVNFSFGNYKEALSVQIESIDDFVLAYI